MERDFLQNFRDALHGSAIFVKIIRILRTGAPFLSKFSGCSAWQRDFERRRRESYTKAIPEASDEEGPPQPRTQSTLILFGIELI